MRFDQFGSPAGYLFGDGSGAVTVAGAATRVALTAAAFGGCLPPMQCLHPRAGLWIASDVRSPADFVNRDVRSCPNGRAARLEHRSALVEAKRVIAYATAQLADLKSVIAELAGLDSDKAGDVLDVGQANLAR